MNSAHRCILRFYVLVFSSYLFAAWIIILRKKKYFILNYFNHSFFWGLNCNNGYFNLDEWRILLTGQKKCTTFNMQTRTIVILDTWIFSLKFTIIRLDSDKRTRLLHPLHILIALDIRTRSDFKWIPRNFRYFCKTIVIFRWGKRNFLSCDVNFYDKINKTHHVQNELTRIFNQCHTNINGKH